jgi:hypothetical protein
MNPPTVLEIVVAVAAAGALAVVASRRPLLGVAAAVFLVPLTAGIQRGILVPALRPDELVILAVVCGLVGHQVTGKQVRPLGLIDLSVGAYAVGSIAIPLLVLTLTQYPATSSVWAAVLGPAWFLGAYFIAARSTLSPEGIRTVLGAAMAAGVVVAAIAVAEAADVSGIRSLVQSIFPADVLSDFRPGSTLGSFSTVGASGVMTFALGLALAATRFPGFSRWWLTLVMSAGVAGAVAAQSWSALLVMPLVTLAVVAYARRVPVELVGAAVVIVVGLVLAGPQIAASFAGQHVVTVGGYVIPDSPAALIRYWGQYVGPAISEQAWLGTGTVVPGSVPTSLAALADNDYISAVFRAGIIGAVLLVAMEISIAALTFAVRASSEPGEPALGAVALGLATILLLLGATGQLVNAGGLAEEIALVVGVTAVALQSASRLLTSTNSSPSRWALVPTGSPVRLAPVGGAPSSRIGPAYAVRRSDGDVSGQTSGRSPAQPAVRPLQSLVPLAAPPRTRRLPARYRVAAIVMVTLLALVLVRISPILTPSNDQLQLRIGNQAVAPIDLRQSVPVSPDLFGANVFPATGTMSVDQSAGFMSYDPATVSGLRSGDVGLLRFPGGGWGEKHLLSLDQLNAFSTLLNAAGAQGMIQARLSGEGNAPGYHSLLEKADIAGAWVDYMDNIHSRSRIGKNANAPFHPVLLWSVGNEPDLSLDDGGQPYTVAEYTDAFIQFSILMHQNNPTIKVFGPELSHFEGMGAGPEDANGHLWMETFIRGVAAYEQAHPALPYHLLDGVSFHFYPGTNPQQASTDLMVNAERWDYVLSPLRQFIRQTLGRDEPIAITEINSYATKNGPPAQLSALWWADTLGTLMNQQLGYLAFFAAEGVDSPYPLMSSKDLSPTSMLRVMQLFSHLQRNLIPLAAQHEPVSVYATQNSTAQTVSLLLINKSDSAQLAQVGAAAPIFGISPWPSLDLSLAPYSATALTLHRGGGAEAFTYAALNGADGAPLTHTMCGQKSDALGAQIPC